MKLPTKEKEWNSLPTGKPHISFSEISDWIDCSWRHMKKQIEKIDFSTPSVALDNGTGIHASCEDFLQTREMNPEIAVDIIKSAFEKHKDSETFWDYIRYSDDEKTFLKLKKKYAGDSTKKEDIIYESYLNEYVEGASNALSEIPKFMDDTFPNWEFVEAEHYLYEPLEKFPKHAFKGYIDGIIKCDAPRGKKKIYWIIDWKTSGWGWTREKKSDEKTRKQLIFYKHFWATKLGVDPKDIRCCFVIIKRVAKPGTRIDHLPISVGDVTTNRSLQVINNMIVSLDRKMYIKNKTNCKWCDFKGTEHCTNSDHPS